MATQDTLTALQFNIQQPETSPAQLLVDSDKVLIGSGAHCEIRLPGDQAANEHVQITFMGGFVYAEAKAMQPAPTIDGAPFSEAPLKPNSILRIGASEITISVVEVAEQAAATQQKKEGTSPVIMVAGGVMVAITLFVFLDKKEPDLVGTRPEAVPQLWQGEAECSIQAKDQAYGQGQKSQVLAEGRRERSPFDVQDGVAAVPLFQEAAACYKLAGKGAEAEEMAAAASELKSKVEEDYRARQMRLEHALEIKDLKVAQSEVKKLLGMLHGQTGEYVVWLSNLERRLKLEMSNSDDDKHKEKKK